MFKTSSLFKISLPLFLLLFVFSCEKEEFSAFDSEYQLMLDEIDQLSAEEYTADLAEFDNGEELDAEMQRLKGKRPCFRFVFPISFAVPTSDAPVVIESQEALRDFLKEWKENQTDLASKPELIFPIEVEFRNGKILEVKSHEALIALQKKCKMDRPQFPKWRLCFDPVFPIFVSVPYLDAPIEVQDKKELHEILKNWKENHPDSDVRPTLVFPFEINTFKGDTMTVNNMDELKKYLKRCIRKMKKGKG